ncbi:hypothetical protein BDQ94DRAFT_133516 [Aspergillus welwitschiae]|uniref:Uncharacterized protein n=1 Tax=Aspergillus welwitschiae TaxID=1341132 RepID=A0A3F3QLB6_9EURO|nr:hypothetical protein BDQ94DRAFT_133516 [Aspergillus welwitschiae]RDH39702.1 hypothetical protein BDQ94DRAFT_133516 [Aspergillus welwitschiae]
MLPGAWAPFWLCSGPRTNGSGPRLPAAMSQKANQHQDSYIITSPSCTSTICKHHPCLAFRPPPIRLFKSSDIIKTTDRFDRDSKALYIRHYIHNICQVP